MNKFLYICLAAVIMMVLTIVLVPTQSAVAATTETKLVAGDGAADDNFGLPIDISGDTIVVGAYLDDGTFNNSGAAYVFTRIDDVWTQEAKLTADDGAAEDRFGSFVAIDGDTIVVGAQRDDVNGDRSGSAYVFTRSGTAWTQTAKLIPSDGAAGDRFGTSVAISGDTVIIGAPQDDDNGDGSGSAYVFALVDDIWIQEANLTPSDGAEDDEFGNQLAIEGNTAVIGTAYNSGEKGAAYVFVNSGGTWTQSAKLTADDGAAEDRFGTFMDIDGDTIVVTSFLDDDHADNSGSVYVFTGSGAEWTQEAKLTADDAAENDFFGYPVAIDGDTVMVGAPRDDDNGDNSGSIYVFTRSDTVWTQDDKFVASDTAAGDWFGAWIAIRGDTIAVAAPFDDDNGDNSGSIYMFKQLPAITSISPVQAKQGKTTDVTITGRYLTGTSVVSFGTGISVNSFTVDSATQITANITVTANATLGTKDILVTNPIGSDTLADGFTLQQAPPTIISISPIAAKQGQALSATITGTYFTGASMVSLGTGITTNSFTVDSATQITAYITVATDATLGTRDVSVTTATGSDTLADGFTVQQAPPTVTSISPATAKQGETLSITITGTDFTGASLVSLGTGITTNSFTVDSATQITPVQ